MTIETKYGNPLAFGLLVICAISLGAFIMMNNSFNQLSDQELIQLVKDETPYEYVELGDRKWYGVDWRGYTLPLDEREGIIGGWGKGHVSLAKCVIIDFQS